MVAPLSAQEPETRKRIAITFDDIPRGAGVFYTQDERTQVLIQRLEEAGVDTVMELAQRNSVNLHKNLVRINKEKSLVQLLPAERQVARWIEQAKTLPRKINY